MDYGIESLEVKELTAPFFEHLKVLQNCFNLKFFDNSMVCLLCNHKDTTSG